MEKHPDVIMPGRRLGRTPMNKSAYRKVIRASKYIKTTRAPKACDYQSHTEKELGKFPMFDNDKLGNCTCCAKAHGLQIMNDVAGHDFSPTTEQVVEAYELSCGYDPSNPDSDQGGNMLDVARWWRDNPITNHKIVAFARVDIPNHNEVKLAIDIFGGVDIGLSLPLSAQDQEEAGGEWRPVRGAKGRAGTWGGHDVWSSRYDGKHIYYVTWDEQKPATWAFNDAYADEGYAYLTEEWLDAQGKSVTGLDIAALRRDLEAKIGPIVALNKYLDLDGAEA